jgi:prevent-host-death family protein
MKKAMISEAKNNLSRLIDAVKRGESVLILDRNTPVARLEPVGGGGEGEHGRIAELVRSGVIAPPRRKLDIAAFLGREMVSPAAGASAVRALLEERRESR